jgi:hypothetical protein
MGSAIAGGSLFPGPVGHGATDYVRAVNQFVSAMNIKSVVEFGCGDFSAGGAMARGGVGYTGVDRSEAVIGRNRALYEGRKVRFLVGDPLCDPLPDGELCLAGQLFRQLTNAEIRLLLLKMRKYRYLLFTDYQPPYSSFIPNLDKPPGAATRLDRGSALDLRKPPFNVRYVEFFHALDAENPVYDPGERLCSFLIRSDYQVDHLDPVYLD